ncbi:LacI family DNA-binding transcriptional regulator [Alloscardovia theropitheci]|uniref:LacI family DNA-binding transcriptional regulator n=1 Tax=Alloscardovia theropitheci TaxID=2496842 RepID=A0A4R0QNZ1_9BIFI|nr:LacI family DNA-binding transcriptional regulator [Alloscardovia theropitheci]TCD53932.1 LacI family DNA-binding transcriptional regulator [Alloscardovia theropitheci]
MTTMKEISALAGVSVSTVSLVLNNRDSGRVNTQTAEHIRALAHQLGYKPNQMARSLRTSRTHILGFLSDEVATTPYAGAMISGAQDAASQYGYVIMTVSTDNEAQERHEIAALERYGVDGFFLAKMSNRHSRVPENLSEYPVVLVNSTYDYSSAKKTSIAGVPRYTGIAPDEKRIGYDATKRLIDAGCTRIAYIGCHEPMIAETLRFEGYQDALKDARIEYDSNLCIQVGNNTPALQAVHSLIDKHHPDGFFCFNDARAWYVYDCAARLGQEIGRDIHIVGVDNHRVLAETLSPQLTTIELPHYEMGYWAACKLISMIEEKDTQDFEIPDTTAPLPSLDNDGDVFIQCALIEKESV